MAGTTKIEWSEAVWNPIRGCSMVSSGCERCYAMRQARRMDHPGGAYEGLTKMTPSGPKWTGDVRTVPHLLDQPLRWTRPRRIFVNSMSDLFHPDVPEEFIDQVFAVMALAPHHVFQVLTKRPGRMREYLLDRGDDLGARLCQVTYEITGMDPGPAPEWPLPNVWLGTSVENQATADERIPYLLETPAAVRWLSCEPLLGPVDLGYRGAGALLIDGAGKKMVPQAWAPHQVDWVVVGGESGPGARPCNVAWIGSLVDQCRGAGVPVFVKQLGADPCIYHEPATENGFPIEAPFREHLRLDGAIRHSKGGDPSEWPEDLRVREYPMEPVPGGPQ